MKDLADKWTAPKFKRLVQKEFSEQIKGSAPDIVRVVETKVTKERSHLIPLMAYSIAERERENKGG